MPYNIFVLGLDELGATELATLPDAQDYVFHPLMTIEELQGGTIDIQALLTQAQQHLDAFEGSIDGIDAFWDFPISMMPPILCERYGLPSNPLLATINCEHTYWTRLAPQRLIAENPTDGLSEHG